MCSSDLAARGGIFEKSGPPWGGNSGPPGRVSPSSPGLLMLGVPSLVPPPLPSLGLGGIGLEHILDHLLVMSSIPPPLPSLGLGVVVFHHTLGTSSSHHVRREVPSNTRSIWVK